MGTILHKNIRVKRDFQYNYLYLTARERYPTLLFLHGFPSSSYDWHLQIDFMRAEGYGIIAPDLLGSGKTSRPLEPDAFRLNLVAADIVEILDNEKVDTVVGVGHDWGCVVLSRLSMLYASRFLAFAWIGLSYMEPITIPFDLDAAMASTKELLGYEGYAYWQFFIKEDAADAIEKNVDSFLQLLYPKDPVSWLTYIALPGKTAEWIDGNLMPGFASYLSAEDIKHLRENVLNGGIKSALNWYISQVRNIDLQDNLSIPEDRWVIHQPSFFAVALRDCICTPERGKASMEAYATDVTLVEFDTGHWPQLESPAELNAELLAWLRSLNLHQ
ncbi:hypothetical protein ACEPAG_5805 [Sanghuangporus baumii]